MVETRFREENANEINAAFKVYKSDDGARKIISENGELASFMPSSEKMNELHNFIADCYGNWH